MGSAAAADAGFGYDDQAAGAGQAEHFGERTLHGSEHRPRALPLESEEHDATVARWRMTSDIADALVQSEEHAASAPTGDHKAIIERSGQPLVDHRVRVVIHRGKVLNELGAQVLVELYAHVP
jgi:hypothetical protein